MKNIAMIIMGLFVFAAACTDPDLDPLKLDEIKSASIITLRSTDIINNSDYVGACDTFSLSQDPGTQSFDFVTDYISEDVNSLSEVQIYAKASATGARTRIATVPGSAFTLAAGDGKYPRASISVPLTAILSGIGKSIGDFAPDQYIYTECDLLLTDGSTVPAGAIVYGALYESIFFYPAHNLLMIAIP